MVCGPCSTLRRAVPRERGRKKDGVNLSNAAGLKVLALDTSSEWCSAALWLDGEVRARQENAGQRHSELILPMIDALLQQARLTVQQMDAIAFGAGPGSFTGLRIACGVAQGLAFAASLPVAGVVTLECLAQASGGERALCALDARMGEIYFAAYERSDAAWGVVHEPVLCRPEQAPAVQGTWTGSGGGFAVHGPTLMRRYAGQLSAVRADLFPHAREVAILGARMAARGLVVDAAEAAPLYIRDKIALSVAERAALGRSRK
jgi:tRNA threonylcarbamoyladenosine biosynthesis protein TsaB